MRSAGIFRSLGPILAAASTLVGCGENEGNSRNFTMSPPAAAKVDMSGSLVNADAALTYATRQAAPAEEATKTVTKTATAGRKIIYNAHVDLVTEDLNTFEAGLLKLIEAQKAYVADSDRTGSAGATRHGSWKIRVPVGSYDDFLRGAVKLGELVSQKADSQDVSEEFFDLEAHQKAKEVEEARLLKHLTESTGKLEEILSVERELSRVRSEIERMQGHLRALANLTTLATVTVSANEIKGYVPPQAPTLGTRIARTFFASVESLQQFGEAILLFVVGLAPWLPVIALGVGFLFLVVRRLASRTARAGS